MFDFDNQRSLTTLRTLALAGVMGLALVGCGEGTNGEDAAGEAETNMESGTDADDGTAEEMGEAADDAADGAAETAGDAADGAARWTTRRRRRRRGGDRRRRRRQRPAGRRGRDGSHR